MNKKFQNIKNKTVVYDELDDYEERDYQDNIEEILEKENNIEEAIEMQCEIEESIIDFEKTIKDILENVTKNLLVGLASIVTSFIILKLFSLSNFAIFIALIANSIFSIFKPGISLLIDYNYAVENIEGYKNQYYFLNEYLVEERKKLEELKKQKNSVTPIKERKQYIIQKVNKKTLKKLKTLLELCHDLGNIQAKTETIPKNKIYEDYESEVSHEEIEHCINMTLNRKNTMQ